jgi:hypothetical protein
MPFAAAIPFIARLAGEEFKHKAIIASVCRQVGVEPGAEFVAKGFVSGAEIEVHLRLLLRRMQRCAC